MMFALTHCCKSVDDARIASCLEILNKRNNSYELSVVEGAVLHLNCDVFGILFNFFKHLRNKEPTIQ